jgi:hypothetical protein
MSSTEFREYLWENVSYRTFLSVFLFWLFTFTLFVWPHCHICMIHSNFWWYLILNKKIEKIIINRTNICDRNSISIRYLQWGPKLCNVWNYKKHKERYRTIVLVTSRPSLPPSSEDIRPSKSTTIHVFTKRKRLTEHVHFSVCMWVTSMSTFSGVIMTHCCCRLCGSEGE